MKATVYQFHGQPTLAVRADSEGDILPAIARRFKDGLGMTVGICGRNIRWDRTAFRTRCTGMFCAWSRRRRIAPWNARRGCRKWRWLALRMEERPNGISAMAPECKAA
jgi:hypothetical protein